MLTEVYFDEARIIFLGYKDRKCDAVSRYIDHRYLKGGSMRKGIPTSLKRFLSSLTFLSSFQPSFQSSFIQN